MAAAAHLKARVQTLGGSHLSTTSERVYDPVEMQGSGQSNRHIYARLIVAGQTPYPFDNISGAGCIQLPLNEFSWWGEASVGHHETVETWLNVTRSSANNLDGAIWWPETAATHNHINLRNAAPSDVIMDSSLSVPVFLREYEPEGMWSRAHGSCESMDTR